MFISAFWCGVLSTIGVEFALLIVAALTRMKKKK